MFEPAKAKFAIGSVDILDLEVKAQYNPKEWQFDQPVKWNEHETFAAQNAVLKPVEFGGIGSETTKVELLFDEVETRDGSVERAVQMLKRFARPMTEQEMNGEWPLRPHFCVATWGDRQHRFDCVIESVSVKYTHFASDGQPLRALITLGLKSGRRPITKAEVQYHRGAQNKRMDSANSNEASMRNAGRPDQRPLSQKQLGISQRRAR